jgi:hypothetical protein
MIFLDRLPIWIQILDIPEAYLKKKENHPEFS